MRKREAFFLHDGRAPGRWNGPKRRALEAFFINNGRARRSNTTDAMGGLVYWQSFDWLLREGLIEAASNVPTKILGDYRLTLAGWEQGRQLWNVPQRTLDRMMSKAGAV